MARSNYLINVSDPSGFASPIPNGGHVAPLGAVVTNGQGESIFTGYYEISAQCTVDNSESLSISPSVIRAYSSVSIAPLAVTLQFPMSFICNWTQSRPDLVEIVSIANGRIMARAKVPTLAGAPMGTLTCSGSVDGNPFNFTFNVVAYVDTITAIQNQILESESIDTSVCTLQQREFSSNGGAWTSFPTSGISVPQNATIQFRGTFAMFVITSRTFQIETPFGVTTINRKNTTTVTTPVYQTGTSGFTVYYQCF